MSAYTTFAFYYDGLTGNVDYPARADYFCRLLDRMEHPAGLTLDLACGTGSLTLELAKRGIDVYGIDGSTAMLSVAKDKAAEENLDLLFLCQQMQKLDLYGTVDTVICALDSVNHLTSESDLLQMFQRVSLFLDPDGIFIFDMNTIYKHRNVLADNVFVYDTEEVFCVWQNHCDSKTNRVSIDLDFFGREGKLYHRSSEHFFERAYPISRIKELLEKAGLDCIAVYDDLSFENPRDDSERVVVVSRHTKSL